MHLENSFAVDAPADQVFAFLVDMNSVLGCVPGAELSDLAGDGGFHGRMRIRAGRETIAYQGSGHVVSRNDTSRTAVLEAQGRETGGSGTARVVVTVRVDERDGSAEVTMATDVSVTGRAAELDEAIVAEVSRGLLTHTAGTITDRVTAPPVVLPIPVLSSEPEAPASPVDRALAIARDRPLALATAGGAAAAAVVVAVLLRLRERAR